MQISKVINSPVKNIRITNKSKSRSVQKNVQKPLPQQFNQTEKEQKSNLTKIHSSSRKQSTTQKSPYKPINKFSLTFGQNSNKKSLKLSVKENNVLTSVQNNANNLNPKEKVSFLKTSNQSSLIRLLMQKVPAKCEKVNSNQQAKKQGRDKNLEQKEIKSDTQLSKKTEKFQLQKSSYKVYDFPSTEKRRQKRYGWLEIQHQFSLKITSSKSTQNVEIQTTKQDIHDKYFMEYMRMRQMKLSSFEVIEAQQSKIKEILKSTVDFSKNYDDLIQAINTGPTNDRQKRIYSLSKDLTNYQAKLSQAFQKVKLVADKLQKHIEHNVYQINKRKSTLFASIQSLAFATLLQLKKQRLSQKPKLLERILQRAHNQLKYLKDLVVKECTYSTKSVMKFNNQIQQVRNTFSEYMNIQLENRVLQYTLIKQIEKIPALMITIFGEDKDLQEKQLKESQMQFDDRLKDYMAAKCEECYHMKKKISFLQFQNQKIKPVFKSLEWLIRDCTKNQCCLSIL